VNLNTNESNPPSTLVSTPPSRKVILLNRKQSLTHGFGKENVPNISVEPKVHVSEGVTFL
jgi:hypothetical protein